MKLSVLQISVLFFLLTIPNTVWSVKLESSQENFPLYQDAFRFSYGGFGLDSYAKDTKLHYPMAHALIASAEYNRFCATGATEALKSVVQHASWLVQHSDINNDGFIGWGLPFSWDAFSDQSENPPHTEYTITTLLCIQALLDTVDMVDSLIDVTSELTALRETSLLVVGKTFQSFIDSNCITTVGEKNAFVSYSSRAVDAYDVVNVNAMWAGVLQRYSSYLPVASKFRKQYEKLCDSVVQLLLENAVNRDGAVYWNYYNGIVPANKKNKENDGVHATYTAEGLLLYQEYRGGLADEIDRFKIYNGLKLYFQNDTIIASFTRKDIKTRTWTLGYFLYLFSKYYPEKEQDIKYIYNDLQKRSGSKGFSFLEPEGGDNHPQYVRHNTHILLGLSYYYFHNK